MNGTTNRTNRPQLFSSFSDIPTTFIKAFSCGLTVNVTRLYLCRLADIDPRWAKVARSMVTPLSASKHSNHLAQACPTTSGSPPQRRSSDLECKHSEDLGMSNRRQGHANHISELRVLPTLFHYSMRTFRRQHARLYFENVLRYSKTTCNNLPARHSERIGSNG